MAQGRELSSPLLLDHTRNGCSESWSIVHTDPRCQAQRLAPFCVRTPTLPSLQSWELLSLLAQVPLWGCSNHSLSSAAYVLFLPFIQVCSLTSL